MSKSSNYKTKPSKDEIEEDDCIKEYNPFPNLLSMPDCLKIYGSFFHSDGEDELLHEVITLSDPITLKRVTIPCRSIYCQHLQCFDYECYVAINQKNECPSQFICPICEEGANPTKLYIDSIYLNLLNYFRDCMKIRIRSDGCCSEYSDKSVSNVILIDQDNTVDSSLELLPSSYSSNSNSKSNRNSNNSNSNSNSDSNNNSNISSLNIRSRTKKPVFMVDFTAVEFSQPFTSVSRLDDLFECNIDDVLYFINNCSSTDLLIIPSIGQYHAERIIKSRPFVCSSFIALRHDLLLKLNRLKYAVAQNMIENLEKIVKNRLLQLKLKYLELSQKSQLLKLPSEGKEKVKQEFKRLKTSKKRTSLSDDDEAFSPIKKEKDEETKVLLKKSSKEEKKPDLDHHFLSEKSKKAVTLNEEGNNVVQPPKLSRKYKQKEMNIDQVSAGSINETTSTPRKKARKEIQFTPNYDEIIFPIKTIDICDSLLSPYRSRSSEIKDKFIEEMQIDVNEPIVPAPIVSKALPVSPLRSVPKKIYFNIDDDNEVNSKKDLSASLTQVEVSNSISSKENEVSLEHPPSTEFLTSSAVVAPSLLFDDEDIFGFGFISSSTRVLESGIGDLVAAGHGNEASSLSNLKKEQQTSDSNKKTANKHIRFTDEDSDTTTQTTSTKNEGTDAAVITVDLSNDEVKIPFRPSILGPVYNSKHSGSLSPTSSTSNGSLKNHMQLLPVFNATASNPTTGILNLSVNTESASRVAPPSSDKCLHSSKVAVSKERRSTSGKHDGKHVSSKERSFENHSDKKRSTTQAINPNKKGTSDSILQLMISEFATGI